MTCWRQFLKLVAVYCLIIMSVAVSCEVSASVTRDLPSTSTFEAVFPPPLTDATSQTRRVGVYELPVRPEQLPQEPFVFHVPKVERQTLPNGIKFYSYQAPHILGFYAVALIEAGALGDPPDSVGLG